MALLIIITVFPKNKNSQVSLRFSLFYVKLTAFLNKQLKTAESELGSTETKASELKDDEMGRLEGKRNKPKPIFGRMLRKLSCHFKLKLCQVIL